MRTGNKKTGYVVLFTLAYFTGYITRVNYGAVISEMVTATGMLKPMLSMGVTGLFIAYGVGQIVSGICGDKFSPKKLVSLGLLTAVSMNFLIPFCQDHIQMLVVWSINGFAQAFIWPPLVRLMTGIFTEEEYNKYVVIVSWGCSFGTLGIYLIAPILISLFNWKAVFFFSAIFGAVMLLIWHFSKADKPVDGVTTSKKEKEEKKNGDIRVMFTPVMFCIILAILCHGMLRDGVTTWIPSYIAETYNLSNSIAILTSVILPLFSVFAFQIAGSLYRRVFTNPLTCSAVFFVTGAVSALVLMLSSGGSAVISIFFAALLTGCMHGVNLILICMIPSFFKEYGIVSTVSGVLNSFTYLGSAVSTYGIALVAEHYNWSVTLMIWFAIAALGTTLCVTSIRPWNKKFGNR